MIIRLKAIWPVLPWSTESRHPGGGVL